MTTAVTLTIFQFSQLKTKHTKISGIASNNIQPKMYLQDSELDNKIKKGFPKDLLPLFVWILQMGLNFSERKDV